MKVKIIVERITFTNLPDMFEGDIVDVPEHLGLALVKRGQAEAHKEGKADKPKSKTVTT